MWHKSGNFLQNYTFFLWFVLANISYCICQWVSYWYLHHLFDVNMGLTRHVLSAVLCCHDYPCSITYYRKFYKKKMHRTKQATSGAVFTSRPLPLLTEHKADNDSVWGRWLYCPSLSFPVTPIPPPNMHYHITHQSTLFLVSGIHNFYVLVIQYYQKIINFPWNLCLKKVYIILKCDFITTWVTLFPEECISSRIQYLIR